MGPGSNYVEVADPMTALGAFWLLPLVAGCRQPEIPRHRLLSLHNRPFGRRDLTGGSGSIPEVA